MITHNHENDTAIGAIFGAIGGTIKILLFTASTDMVTSLFSAVLTAFLCGIAGVVGKECYVLVKRKIKKR